MPHGWELLAGTKEMEPPGPVPAATSEAPAFTEIVALAASETMAQGWMVTMVPGPLIAMLFGTEWVTPPPSQVSLAAMLAEWVTTWPVGGPQLTAPLTVTVALPDREGSATL